MRSDENYAYLKSAPKLTSLDPLRYIPLGEDAFVAGGEASLRLSAIDAPRMASAALRPTVELFRGLVSADLDLNSSPRLYGELGLHRDRDRDLD